MLAVAIELASQEKETTMETIRTNALEAKGGEGGRGGEGGGGGGGGEGGGGGGGEGGEGGRGGEGGFWCSPRTDSPKSIGGGEASPPHLGAHLWVHTEGPPATMVSLRGGGQ